MAAKTSEAIFLDSGFFAFCAERGVALPEALERLKGKGEFCVNVKTLQEIVYRYHLLGETQRGYDYALQLRKQAKVLPVTHEDLLKMDGWLDRFPNLSPRELIHLAVLDNHGIRRLACAPQSHFRDFPGLETVNLVATAVPHL